MHARRIVIASDGVSALFGALAGSPGVVVSAGTGTVALAHDGRRWARVDGWGSLLGDAGSGFAIGRAGLDAALREHDGRGGSPALLRAAEREFGPAAHLVSRIHRTGSPTMTVAGFAPAVVEEAVAGDAAATEIVGSAGRELAVSVAAALRAVFGADETVSVSWAGNVFLAGAPLFSIVRARARPSLPQGGAGLAPGRCAQRRRGARGARRQPAAGPGPGMGGGMSDPLGAMAGGLVVSVQAPPDSPLRDPARMAAMARAAEAGGACAIRADGAGDSQAIGRRSDCR